MSHGIAVVKIQNKAKNNKAKRWYLVLRFTTNPRNRQRNKAGSQK